MEYTICILSRFDARNSEFKLHYNYFFFIRTESLHRKSKEIRSRKASRKVKAERSCRCGIFLRACIYTLVFIYFLQSAYKRGLYIARRFPYALVPPHVASVACTESCSKFQRLVYFQKYTIFSIVIYKGSMCRRVKREKAQT